MKNVASEQQMKT